MINTYACINTYLEYVVILSFSKYIDPVFRYLQMKPGETLGSFIIKRTCNIHYFETVRHCDW